MKFGFALLIILIFISCADKDAPTGDENEKYSKMGMKIVKISSETLQSHLANALRNEGYGGAITYCNFNATPLIDSLSRAFNATVRRTSLKVRNPKDAPNEDELGALNLFMETHKKGEKLKPLIRKFNDTSFAYYSPIIIGSPICLGCHGEPGKSNAQGIFDAIKELYPNDKATGYKMGDFRGMWSVKFGK